MLANKHTLFVLVCNTPQRKYFGMVATNLVSSTEQSCQ